MKPFKFVDELFSRFFHQFYHDNDTYKDAEGKGILERFLLVCSEYFDESITPEIEHLIDVIDVDKTSGHNINLLWEYFGFIPYAYGILNQGQPYTKDNLDNWLNRQFPIADYRSILKFAISLYKIRCTKDFYTILGKFYNIRIELIEPSNLPFDGDYKRYDEPDIKYDNNEEYDQTLGCLECIEIKANIYIPKGVYLYLTENNQLSSAKDAIQLLLNKYLPINVKEFNSNTITLIEDNYLIIKV